MLIDLLKKNWIAVFYKLEIIFFSCELQYNMYTEIILFSLILIDVFRFLKLFVPIICLYDFVILHTKKR